MRKFGLEFLQGFFGLPALGHINDHANKLRFTLRFFDGPSDAVVISNGPVWPNEPIVHFKIALLADRPFKRLFYQRQILWMNQPLGVFLCGLEGIGIEAKDAEVFLGPKALSGGNI